MDLKDLIKSRRLALNLTLEEIAAQVGVSRATVSRWESGNISNMRRDRIAKLAAALRTTPDYIMGCSDDPEPATKVSTEFVERKISNDDLMFALWGDNDNITEGDLEDVRRYAAFIAERKKG